MSTGTFLDGEEQCDITLKKGRLHLPDGKPIPIGERCYTSTPTTGKKKAPKGHREKTKSILPKTSLPKTTLAEKTTLPKTTLFPKTPMK
ncbi:MAG TPA: hypothetical protein DEA43_01435 [Candidatus Moranbacteria bacterium]|nr:hypothetical protein [Candidatus Moranbacteria bacterium]HBT45531.1 hypothetical protein [Candidatus Moranbacteria bacterium]